MADFDRMDRMMSQFTTGGAFGSIMQPPSHSIMPLQPQQQMSPFGSMFGQNMFGNMGSMMSQMENSPNSQCFSSSRVISYSNTGGGEPKYYEATSQTTQGPGGVRQTRKSERNSETGVNKMAVGHHIYDRGHVVERSHNRRTNEKEERHDYANLDEEEKDSFHKEWQERARSSSSRSFQNRREPRAINSSEYQRQNLERSRARHAASHEIEGRPTYSHGDRDRDAGRHVRINSRIDEI